MKTHIIGILCMGLGLAGCAANTPTTYLVLSPVSGPVYTPPGLAVAVGRVIMPPSIDRSFLTTGSSENVMTVSYNAQWAAPLEPMARTVLARDLAARLPGHLVVMPGDNVPPHALVVSLNVVTFLPYPADVVLEADWSIADTGLKTAQTGRARITTPSATAAAGQAQAMSQALGQLADQIASRIAGH